jgi:SAM-dependent methyltransferase
MNNNLKRYELFGWDYQHFNPLSGQKIDWYLKFARKTKGPILELACGTARLAIELAKNGFDIDAIDLSESMLETARKNISRLTPETQSRVRLHNMDISGYTLDRRYGLIFIADNSFRELVTREQQLSCLKCTHKHLLPDGFFLMTVRRFDADGFVNGQKETAWSEPVSPAPDGTGHPITGAIVQRKMKIRLSKDGTKTEGILLYKITDTGGNQSFEECPFESIIMSTDDYITLLSEAGLAPTVYVGYEEKMDDGKNPILCFVCTKQGRL